MYCEKNLPNWWSLENAQMLHHHLNIWQKKEIIFEAWLFLFRVLVVASKKTLLKNFQLLRKEKEKRPLHLTNKRCLTTTFKILAPWSPPWNQLCALDHVKGNWILNFGEGNNNDYLMRMRINEKDTVKWLSQEGKGNACLDDGDERKQRCSSVRSAHEQWKLERCKRTQNLRLIEFSMTRGL